ncbi:hypothetical protein CEN49_22680 [Fischerella thermalis CCMEE 5273]|nr:hypothetical protein CEN49_22680 [Fischerella thermalis CCMEE 5273]
MAVDLRKFQILISIRIRIKKYTSRDNPDKGDPYAFSTLAFAEIKYDDHRNNDWCRVCLRTGDMGILRLIRSQ